MMMVRAEGIRWVAPAGSPRVALWERRVLAAPWRLVPFHVGTEKGRPRSPAREGVVRAALLYIPTTPPAPGL